MKVYDVINEACMLAGGCTPDEHIKKAGVGLINTVLNDLRRPGVTTLYDELPLNSTAEFTPLINGVAMLLCMHWGDDSGFSALSEIYESSKKQLFCNISSVKARPLGGDGV